MRLSLNKSSLKQQRDALGMYRRFLPSLDLKRQQLLTAWREAREELAEMEKDDAALRKRVERFLPLLGSSTLRTRDLSSLVRVRAVRVESENVVGARVPVVRSVDFERTAYSTLTLPFWVDQLVDELENSARMRLQMQVQQERVSRLELASRKVTQRVNLFEKILIPTAKRNIKRIQIALSDEERSAVIRSKLSKKKHQ
jgi:V/A-type H+-transporting ATPase subunit D